MVQTAKPDVYTIGQLTDLIKSTLEAGFPVVTVEGEISNFRPSSAGHCYFTLKDEHAMIQAVMFRGRASALPFQPEDGMLVRAVGSISVYAKRGTYQIICETMSLAGAGAILAMLEQRKRELAAEGLFDQERKKPLPSFPQRVAVVTSPTGAAIRDIVNVIGRRHAGISLVVVPAPVQGDGAAEKIAAAIARADRHRLGDVIIVGRGGGSLEDLLPFSDTRVVRAIAACETPVISAVGHEIDVSLSDLVADLRAPTPSAAAELVSADREQVRRQVIQLGRDVVRSFAARIDRARLSLSRFAPSELERTVHLVMQPSLQRLDEAKEALVASMERRLTDNRHRLTLAARQIEDLSPFAVLKRGFAVVTHHGRVVTDAATLKVADPLTIRFASGTVDAHVDTHGKDSDAKGTNDEGI